MRCQFSRHQLVSVVSALPSAMLRNQDCARSVGSICTPAQYAATANSSIALRAGYDAATSSDGGAALAEPEVSESELQDASGEVSVMLSVPMLVALLFG